jgi:hypothetical protein
MTRPSHPAATGPTSKPRNPVRRLQVGLVSALVRGLSAGLEKAQATTSIVEPGHVAEGGEIQEW